MKKCIPLILLILSLANLLYSCKKNSVEEKYQETVSPVIPDLSTQINATVNGFVTDENGTPVEGATVKKGTSSTLTDEFGYFRLPNINFAKTAGFVEVTKNGYFKGIRTFIPVEGKETLVQLQLTPKTIVGTINSSSGGTVTTTDAASVSLPANAVVIASNNAPYTGTIHVAMHWLDPANDITQLTMPGDLRGIDSSGYLNVLSSYGMLAVELSGDAGELLQIANGMKASLNFPLPASLQSTAPASIPLWYFDENNGLWKEDGAAQKNGNSYQGDVSHFSWWNCDVPNSLVNYKIQMVNTNLEPISGLSVSVSITGFSNPAFTAITNNEGKVCMMVPANAPLKIRVSSECNSNIYSTEMLSTNADVDQGTIQTDALQYSGTFVGTVNKCSGLPVTNGYVIIAGTNQLHAVEIENGTFSTAILVCPNATVSVVAVDRDASLQSPVQSVVVVSGENNCGTLAACNSGNSESISFLIDGFPTNLSAPFHLFTASFDPATFITNIHAVDQVSLSTSFDVSFSGPASITGSHEVEGSIILNGDTYSGSFSNFSLNYYGIIGEFISGSFVGDVNDSMGVPHTVICSFNVRRDS